MICQNSAFQKKNSHDFKMKCTCSAILNKKSFTENAQAYVYIADLLSVMHFTCSLGLLHPHIQDDKISKTDLLASVKNCWVQRAIDRSVEHDQFFLSVTSGSRVPTHLFFACTEVIIYWTLSNL